MSASGPVTLGKEERITSKILIDELFNGNHSHSMVAFPIRLVYMEKAREEACPPVQLLVSVPKRCFKRAVKRNRVKRQMREAYRHHKHLLVDCLQQLNQTEETGTEKVAVLGFIWLDAKLYDTVEVEQRMKSLLERVAEKLSKGRP